MKRMRRLVLLAAVVGAATVAAVTVLTRSASSVTGGSPNLVLARQLDYELGKAVAPKWQQHASAGLMYTLLQANGYLDKRADTAGGKAPAIPSANNTQGCQNTFTSPTGPPNIRVNQDCSFRRQAEEVIAVNPVDPKNLIAGQNDSRIGFNHCGYDWSLNNGNSWGDQIPPFYQFIQNDNHTADACSDPTATFDAQGNAYIGAVLFDVASGASSIVALKSNAGIDGQFWHTPAAIPFQLYRDTPVGVIASNSGQAIAHDKEFIVADATVGSPKANNVYMTWTRFNAASGNGVGANSPIYFSQSTDGGATWSKGIEIDGSNAHDCTDFSGESDPNACDQDQGSHPIVGPDGTIYVAFGNGNTPTPGVNQHMIVTCPVANDCSKRSSWTAPVKISDDFGTQPVGPDATSGCPGGRQCLPPNGYRLDDFVEGSLSMDAGGNLFFTWADFRHGGPPCDTGDASTSTPPCDNDVFYAYSTNHGASWSPAIDVSAQGHTGHTAQWMPWSTVNLVNGHLEIAYYDRSYGDCETTGCNDITLASVRNPATGSPSISFRRITTSSMPNLVVANNPVQAGFLGDYMWVAQGGSTTYITWADTRGLSGSVEEDIYMARVGT